MSFLVAAALAVGLLVGIPIVAHLLRRGRTQEQAFPPAVLVPVARSVARQRSRLEDRALLALRAAIVVALAMLGATPLINCSRLSLGRNAGASVALALVVDDSLSMRAKTPAGPARWELALRAGKQLLDSAREGDAVAIVLAGKPARLALAITTDLALARRSLAELKPSDRSTDLQGALGIARSSLTGLPHTDKRVIVLSDLAGPGELSGEPRVSTPVAELSATTSDCGITSAERRGKRVQVTVACNGADAAKERSLRAVAAEPEAKKPRSQAAAAQPSGSVIAEERLAARAGLQTLALEVDPKLGLIDVELTGQDSLERDDRATVPAEVGALIIGVSTDPERAGAVTGGPPLLEQALGSLNAEASLRPLPALPEEASELRELAAILIDDPAGLTPEARGALGQWTEKGGVALALLGPRAANLQLGATLEPFAQGAVHWQKTEVRGTDTDSLSWLGPEAPSLAELAPKGRAVLDGAEPQGARVVGRWDDGKAWLLERRLGRGALFTVALPASLEQSDFALRPGFLALLDYLVVEATNRSGPRKSLVGTLWSFPRNVEVEVIGPEGPLPVRDSGGESAEKHASLALAGHYRVKIDGELQDRSAVLDPDEITALPRAPLAGAAATGNAGPSGQIDASSELGLVLIVLIALELLLRMLRASRVQRSAA